MINYLTLADARAFVKRFVENGSCNSETVDSRINEAVRRLLPKVSDTFNTAIMRIRCDNQTFALPREAEKIIGYSIDGQSNEMFNQHYQFVSAGPGDLAYKTWCTGYKDLADMGHFPTMFDVPQLEVENLVENYNNLLDREFLTSGLNIVAFSDQLEDVTAGLQLSVYGYDKLNQEIRYGGTLGGSFRINYWTDGVPGMVTGALSAQYLSAQTFRQVTLLSKPITKGYIWVYAVNAATNYMYLLAIIHPDDTKPRWRRYKITNVSDREPSNILARVKLAAVPLTRADDVLPIQSLDALKLMVKAITLENADKIQEALAIEQNAIRLLAEQVDQRETTMGVPTIIDRGPLTQFEQRMVW